MDLGARRRGSCLHRLATAAVREHARRRLGFALGRFAGRVTSVWVRLEDLNGPRGGVDKQCRVEVRGTPRWRVVVVDSDADLYATVDRAADRVRRTVARMIGVLKEHHGATPAPLPAATGAAR
jgi:putative sigma-54 modulation protein